MIANLVEDAKATVLAVMDDATLSTLLGVTEADPRIYWYYNGDAEVDEQRPVYITYANIATPAAGGTTAPVISLNLWGKSIETVEAVRNRLVGLFERTTLTSSGGRTIYSRFVNEQDQFQEQPKFAGKAMHLQLSFLTLR